MQLDATRAHPATAPGGNAQHERVSGDIPIHDGSGANERVLTDRDAANDRAIGAQSSAATNERLSVLVLANDGRARIVDIGKHHARTAENIVLQTYRIVDRYVVLDLDVVSDDDVVADENALAKRAIGADTRPGADMCPVPDPAAFANLGALVNDGAGVDGVI